MLRWRLILGTLLIAAMAGLCWLDARPGFPGAVMALVAIVVTGLCASELLAMFNSRGFQPARWAYYSATLMPVIFSAVPILQLKITQNYTMGALGWLAVGLAAGLAVAFLGELWRFTEQRQSIAHVSLTAFAVLYVGGCMGALVQLRLARAPMDISGARGLLPLLAFIVTVKLSDICQYIVGRTIGRHKLAPKLSPGKTWEGAVGGIGLACGLMSALITLRVYGTDLFKLEFLQQPLLFTSSVAIAGLMGDLSESMLKRDAGMKDSSTWLPGFGGVLDLLDSLLLAAPVAYLWFANGYLDLDPLQGLPGM